MRCAGMAYASGIVDGDREFRAPCSGPVEHQLVAWKWIDFRHNNQFVCEDHASWARVRGFTTARIGSDGVARPGDSG